MEPKFQTSFIPKKPLPTANVGMQTARRPSRRGVSIYMTLAVILFIVSLGSIGGAYAWTQYLTSAQVSYKTDLINRQKQFNVDLISQLKQVNVQIDTAKQLLNNHLALSGIFGIIGALTSEDVRFTSLDLTAPATPGDTIKVSLSGYGTSLAAVAFQSDVLGQLAAYNVSNISLNKIVKNPILSNPALTGNGTVSFGFTADIDPSTLSYERSVTGPTATGGSSSAVAVPPPASASSTTQ